MAQTAAATASDSSKNEISEDDTDESAPFAIAHNTKFTFKVPLTSAPLSDITSLGNICNLKRIKGHLDGPIVTLGNSPQKKRTWVDVGTKDLPLPSLLFPPSVPEPLSASNDVFGPSRPEAEPSSDSAHTPGSLFTFWHRESAEEKTERNSQEFEELSKTREQRELSAERAEAMRKARQRAGDCERQQRHRDLIHNMKVASGWKPNQKHVSLRLI